MSDEELVWEAPPAARSKSMYDPAIAALKKKPGAWARIRTIVHSGGKQVNAHNMRGGFLNAAKDERFEAVVRKVDDEENAYGLWARYRSDEQMKAAKKR